MVSCGTVTVEEPFDPSLVVVADCSVGQGPVSPSGSLVGSARFFNDNQAGSAEVAWEVFAGTVSVASGVVTVPAGTERVIDFSFVPQDVGLQTGDHAVDVDFSVSESAQAAQMSAPVVGFGAPEPADLLKNGCGCNH